MPRAGVARRVNGRQRELQRLGNRYFCLVDRPKGSVDIAVSVCLSNALAPNFRSIPPTMWRQAMTEMDVDAAHQSSCAYGEAAPAAAIRRAPDKSAGADPINLEAFSDTMNNGCGHGLPAGRVNDPLRRKQCMGKRCAT